MAGFTHAWDTVGAGKQITHDGENLAERSAPLPAMKLSVSYVGYNRCPRDKQLLSLPNAYNTHIKKHVNKTRRQTAWILRQNWNLSTDLPQRKC